MYKLLLVICLLATSLTAQERVIKDFIKVHRKGEDNVAVKVPGWLIGLASNIGVMAVEETEEKALMELLGDVGTLRVVTYDNRDFTAPQESVVNLLYSLERYKDFERWAEVRTQTGERVTLTVRYRKQRIRDLVVVVQEETRTTLVAARADLLAEDLGELVNSLAAAD